MRSDRADRSLLLARPAAVHPIGLRDVPIEFHRLRSRSAYQTQSSRPPSGFAPLGRLARKIALKCNFRPHPTAAHLAVRCLAITMGELYPKADWNFVFG
jgi:hypothetical protein